jgi:zinc D-Ala-D-Ala dipeptidase
MKHFLAVFFTLFILGCKRESPAVTEKIDADPTSEMVEEKAVTPEETSKETVAKEEPKKETEVLPEEKKVKSDFKEITPMSGIAIDIKYATSDNFTKKQIYPCGKCFLRPEATEKIVKAHKILKEKYGYGLKMFDCYRPLPAQQRLWDVVPNADYVTPPSKGSMHNKGLAVDLTIVDKEGKELNMGTPYDFFGKEAHTDNLSLPKQVLENRNILKSVMNELGFNGIRTEWWHFSLNAGAELSSWEWKCN